MAYKTNEKDCIGTDNDKVKRNSKFYIADGKGAF